MWDTFHYQWKYHLWQYLGWTYMSQILMKKLYNVFTTWGVHQLDCWDPEAAHVHPSSWHHIRTGNTHQITFLSMILDKIFQSTTSLSFHNTYIIILIHYSYDSLKSVCIHAPMLSIEFNNKPLLMINNISSLYAIPQRRHFSITITL